MTTSGSGWSRCGSDAGGGPLSRTASMPARLCQLKPNVPRQAGVKGATPPCRRRHSCEEPWYTTDVPFVVLGLRTPSYHTAGFAILAGW